MVNPSPPAAHGDPGVPTGEIDPSALRARRDPAGEAPWAMPIVVRAEKDALPSAAAVAEACGCAVVRLLVDPRAGDGWAAQVDRWLDGRIRKVARRARGARWDAVQDVPGITVEHAGAQVRAFVPMATDELPAELSKLQVAGLELDAGEPSPRSGSALAVALTPHVAMSPLKAAVQVGHAAQLALDAVSDAELATWQAGGFAVRLVRPRPGDWAALVAAARVAVRDAGYTEIPPGTRTTVALWSGLDA